MNSRFSVFPKPVPVLSRITHSLGSDSSHKPTVSDLSFPQHESAIEIGQEEEEEEVEEEEGKRRRRKKKKKKKPPPSQDCLFFFLIFTRACACGACAPLVPSIRTRSWMFNKEIKCLNSHQKKKKKKAKQTKKFQKAKTKREKERKKKSKTNKQTNKTQPASTSNQPAQATRVCHPERGVSGPWWRSCRGDRQGDRGRETP